MWTSRISRDDVIKGKFAALFAAILACVVIPSKYFMAGEMDDRTRPVYHFL
jgi:ABC-type transport system involved in multi-copper enzyme maturation permease subunit